ncbi:MAG: fructose 1,6-bisphosphatase [Anaerolineales bacterium]|nr:fructose 1,6-bisphosphatase [Anaerolineales bacterium]
MFDDPGFDEVRNLINTIAKHLRCDGPFEPHRLPMDELEDTTFLQVMDKLKGRWQPLPE